VSPGVVRRLQLKGRHSAEAMTKKGRQFFGRKIGWHHQLPPRVTPTLVTPLPMWQCRHSPGICAPVPISRWSRNCYSDNYTLRRVSLFYSV